jgi:hypothetical protein
VERLPPGSPALQTAREAPFAQNDRYQVIECMKSCTNSMDPDAEVNFNHRNDFEDANDLGDGLSY